MPSVRKRASAIRAIASEDFKKIFTAGMFVTRVTVVALHWEIPPWCLEFSIFLSSFVSSNAISYILALKNI